MSEIRNYTLNFGSGRLQCSLDLAAQGQPFSTTLNFGSGITRAARALASTEVERVCPSCEHRGLRGAAYV